MAVVTVKIKSDLPKLKRLLDKMNNSNVQRIFDKYGQIGVEELSAATPVDSGVTASCWSYEVHHDSNSVSLQFFNSNENKGVPIAVILQYGHGTGTGGWVQGRDYINPALRPVFDRLAEEVWREVSRL